MTILSPLAPALVGAERPSRSPLPGMAVPDFDILAPTTISGTLARVMFEVMVKAVLDRLPDYEIDLDGVHTYKGNPTMTGLGKLPVRFTPGPTLATPRPE